MFAQLSWTYCKFRSSTGANRRVIAIVGHAVALLGMAVILAPYTGCKRYSTDGISRCSANMEQVGRAIETYRYQNGGWHPFHEDGPMHSLALLYPRFTNASLAFFACPATQDSPGIKDGRLVGCSYGYDHRMGLDPTADAVILAETPGNHEKDGFSVLHVDYRYSWETDPCCSQDPDDDIFSEDPTKDPDEDAYISW